MASDTLAGGEAAKTELPGLPVLPKVSAAPAAPAPGESFISAVESFVKQLERSLGEAARREKYMEPGKKVYKYNLGLGGVGSVIVAYRDGTLRFYIPNPSGKGYKIAAKADLGDRARVRVVDYSGYRMESETKRGIFLARITGEVRGVVVKSVIQGYPYPDRELELVFY